jgi:hypothetical protein
LIEVDADERTKHQRRDGLQEPDGGHLERRSGQFIDEPQQRDLVQAVADLGDNLACPKTPEIPGS